MTIETYGLELEPDAQGWEIRWSQAQTDTYGIEIILARGSGRPTQADYDLAWRTWAIANIAGVLPPPLGCLSAEEILARPAQNAPSTEVTQ